MQINTSSETMEAVEAAVKRLGIEVGFSALPQSLADVLRTPAEDEDAFDIYHRFLQREPGFAARVLSLANSPAMGARTPMKDLSAALTWLGTTGVRGAILSVAVMEAARGQTRLLLQAVGCASFCARVGSLVANRDAGEFFVAGLLHNIGKLLVLNASHAPSPPVCARLVDGTLTNEEEREALGCTHAEIGAWFARRWRFPPELVEAIRHSAGPPPDAGLMDHVVAHGREWVCNFSLEHLETPPNTSAILDYFETRHGIARSQMLAALDGLADDVEQLTLHLHEAPPSLAQTMRLLQEANLTLGDLNAQAEAMRRETEEQLRHLRLLQELANTSGLQPTIEAMCEHAVTLISKRLGMGVVSIMKPNEQGDLVVVAGVGIPRAVIGDPGAVKDSRVAQAVMREGLSVLVTDFSDNPSFPLSAHAKRYSTSSALSVPLPHAGRVLAVLNVNNKHSKQPMNERDKRLLETIGHHLGSLLNAEEQRTRLERSENRFQALAAATPAALAGFDNAGRIWLWNQSVARLTGIPEGEALGKPIPDALIPEDQPGALDDWRACLRANNPIHSAPCTIRDSKGRPASILSTVVPLEGGRVGVWMGVNITGERNAQLDAKKRAIEIAAMNRVMTRILSELERDRMLAIFIEEAVNAAVVEKGALVALEQGEPCRVLVSKGFKDTSNLEGLLAWTAGAMPEATVRYDESPGARVPAATAFLEREAIRDAVVVRLPVPTDRGFVLVACNTADPGAVENATRVLEDMATVAAIGLRVAQDLENRVRYEQLHVAAGMAITYNHEANNALQMIQAAVDFANQAGCGIEGEDLKAVEQAIHTIQRLNEALGSKFVPAFVPYAGGLDMVDARASSPDREGPA